MEVEKHLHKKDIYGRNLSFYMKQFGFNIDSTTLGEQGKGWFLGKIWNENFSFVLSFNSKILSFVND